MPQPDSGDNCCDCPSRTSPCDDCGGVGGACCQFGSCSITPDEATCLAIGYGAYYNGDGTICADIDCTLLGCCFSLDGQTCTTEFGSSCGTTFFTGTYCCGVANIFNNPGCCDIIGIGLNTMCCINADGINNCCNPDLFECCDVGCCPIGFCIDGICTA